MKENIHAPWEIYNLTIDKGEKTNVADQYPLLIKRFEEILKQQHQPSHIREWEFVAPKFPNKS